MGKGKNILKCCLILITLCILLTLGQISKAVTYANTFEYELNSGVAVIKKYIGNGNQVAVPAEIAGTTRIKIAKGAFESNSLEKIVILKNVTKIEQGAFSQNTKAVIYGKQDSVAEKYAKENNIKFRVYGDINGDGNVSATDTLKVKRHIVELRGYILNEDEQIRADINCDGKVTTTDLLTLKKVIVGLDEPERPEEPEEQEDPEQIHEMTEEIVELNNLKWNKDYYYGERDSEEWKVNQGAVSNKEWQSVWNGEISRIRVPGDGLGGNNDEVEIIGNYYREGKGAAWAELERGNIKKIEFDYLIDKMDSIEEAGIMLNVEKNGDVLEGYMICFTSNVTQYVDVYGKEDTWVKAKVRKRDPNKEFEDGETYEVVRALNRPKYNSTGYFSSPNLFDRFMYSNILIRSMNNIPKKIFKYNEPVGRILPVGQVGSSARKTYKFIVKEQYVPLFTEKEFDVWGEKDKPYICPDIEIIDWVGNYLGRPINKSDLSGVICKFKYKIGDNENLMNCEKGELELIDVFNAGSWQKVDYPIERNV